MPTRVDAHSGRIDVRAERLNTARGHMDRLRDGHVDHTVCRHRSLAFAHDELDVPRRAPLNRQHIETTGLLAESQLVGDHDVRLVPSSVGAQSHGVGAVEGFDR